MLFGRQRKIFDHDGNIDDNNSPEYNYYIQQILLFKWIHTEFILKACNGTDLNNYMRDLLSYKIKDLPNF